MGAIKHKIFMVLKIVNIILSTQIPLNNNEINNFRKIIIPSPFKYPTRMLCCASFREKINKFCKTAFFCYKNQNYDNTQNDDKNMDYSRLLDYKENRDYDGWDGICKNKLYHIGNAAKRVDITLMNPSEIKKSFLPFRIDDEDIESYEVNELIHKIKSGEIIITPKIASLIFYDFHMNIYKDIQILYKRAQQRLNSLAIKYKFSSEKHALYKITLKKLIFRKSTNIMYRSLLIYEEYAVSYINELKLTFHIFLKQYCETICSIFKKIELAFFCGFSKLIVTVRRDQIRLIKEDEDELFFFT
ncbi:Plasmodium exported protein, unknown function [Plasmodium berghei]|uniref:Gamete antigen 27/25 n=1 Tax=Plasmodium berghei TaxID=5821 RepID=A0A1C6YML2_PLABE|nr:Plasmodium exported protein, unknown function [Plasmodium berghei]SCO63538.1 Plasmodium exported protein, unknown function [Plasmodium berghei]